MLAHTSASRRLDLDGDSCDAGGGTGPPWSWPRELRLCGRPRAGPRNWLRLDPAQDHAAPAEVELGLVADQDQLQRDDALPGDGRLDEQPAIELERQRALAAPADRVHLGDDLGPPAVEPVGRHQAADPQVRPAMIVVREERHERALGVGHVVEVDDLPQLALHGADHRLDLAATLRAVRLAQRVIDQLLVEKLLAARDVAPRGERGTSIGVDPFGLAVEPDRLAHRRDYDLARRTLGEHVPDDEPREVVLDHEQPAPLAADPELGEVELPERVAVRRLEPARVLVADRPTLAMHRRVPRLAQHAGDRLHGDPPAEEPLELGADLRRPHRRVLLLVVEDRLDLVLAEPGTWIVRRAGRCRLRDGRLRRGRRVIALALALADLGHQPLLLALRVPPAQRLGRAADRLGDLLTPDPVEHQRQCTCVLGRREPAASCRDTLTAAATRTGLRDTVTFTRRM